MEMDISGCKSIRLLYLILYNFILISVLFFLENSKFLALISRAIDTILTKAYMLMVECVFYGGFMGIESGISTF